MADIAKSGTPSLATVLPCATHKLTLEAGEAIAAGDACYVKSDGKLWKSTGAAANAAAVVDGFALSAAAAGEALTVAHGVRLEYGSGLTPGAGYFLSANAGLLADAASTGGTVVVARAVDATRIEVRRSW